MAAFKAVFREPSLACLVQYGGFIAASGGSSLILKMRGVVKEWATFFYCTAIPPSVSSSIPFQRSSVVERSAVNRLVVGSNPTAGAILSISVRNLYFGFLNANP